MPANLTRRESLALALGALVSGCGGGGARRAEAALS